MQEIDTTKEGSAAAGAVTHEGLQNEPVDVLLLTNKPEILPQVAKLLSTRNLTYAKMPVDSFSQIRGKLALIGTTIIDASGLTLSQQKSLLSVIDALEAQNIATVILNSWIEFSESRYALSGKLYSATLEELWGRIQANIAYRKKTSSSAVNATKTSPTREDDNANKALMADMMAEQLKMAGRVQRDFLPSNLPNTDRLHCAAIFKPAEWVSGDIYDIVRLDEHHIGFYVADAVGHSLPAALLTIFLKHEMVMRETTNNSYRIFEPVEVIQNLNRRMAQQKLSGCQFATCCYCLLNMKTLELKFARGGHPYPILVRRDGQIRQLQLRGPLLGIFEHAEYLQDGVQLERGDKLFLYSDGVEPLIGKFDTHAGFVFTEGFKSITHLPVKEALDALNTMVANKTFTAAETDDITVVGLELL
ncbi:MAG: SpoIIE family protein phosphatase [Sedimentisphaerales bacterium]|nr:SpoIIE family protein phosphatase [Sedimentisphaerales bacterium]